MLLNTLHLRFGIGSTALDWFKSYLTGRSQRVTIGSSSSMATPVYHGVPQGSVLGPVLFNVYTTPIADICKKHQVHYHRFADDIQLYVSYNPAESEELNDAKIQLIQCIDEIRAWMLLHQLKLNDDNRVHGAAIIAQPTRARQPNLATSPTHTNINAGLDIGYVPAGPRAFYRLSGQFGPQQFIFCWPAGPVTFISVVNTFTTFSVDLSRAHMHRVRAVS